MMQDADSGMREYWWAVGTVPGGSQLLPFTSTGTSPAAESYGLRLHHGMRVYVSVTGRNGAGRTTTVVSDPIFIDHTPPVSGTVLDLDGLVSGVDAIVTESAVLRASWTGFADAESGLQWCDVAFGRAPGSQEVYPFTPVLAMGEVGLSTSISGLGLAHGTTYYASVKCANMADLVTIAFSDGITYIAHPPTSTNAEIFITNAFDSRPSVYFPRGAVQPDNIELKVHWTGFDTILDFLKFEVFVREIAPASQCAAGQYYDPTQFNPSARCRTCHPGCSLCTGPDHNACQACATGYRHDGRACHFHGCPSGFTDDPFTSTCWRPAGSRASAVFDFTDFPLRQGFTYETSVRAYYEVGGRQRSPAVSTSLLIDTTPPVLLVGDIVSTVRNSSLTVDWSVAVLEDVTSMQFMVALGTVEQRGRWDISDWIPVGTAVRFTHESAKIFAGRDYVAGLRIVNDAGLEVSGTVDVLFPLVSGRRSVHSAHTPSEL